MPPFQRRQKSFPIHAHQERRQQRPRACRYLTVLLSVCTVAGWTQNAPHAPEHIPRGLSQPSLGTAWYPEQWPEAQWEHDLNLMESAHIHLVRVGEFAWSTLEPREGEFHFEWLERAIAAAGRHDIRVVLGTPTATPPAWLTTKYPETLRTNERGVRMEHGDREQANWANPHYLALARDIAVRMGQRFGHNPNVIGWQIDNEISQTSADPETQRQFQDWLAQRYGTLDALNRRWTTAYWSESYTDWQQIPIPKNAGVDAGNPGLLLSWRLFLTDRWVHYVKNQTDALRPLCDPRMVFTTNTMGFFPYFDHYPVLAQLDLAAWDDYFAEGSVDPVANGAANDLTRGFKGRNFWVMETQPGFVNWSSENASLPPGEVRAVAWHDVGHGADMVSYWQWRSALNGQEQYHGTIVGPDGEPNPIYHEIRRTGEEFDSVAAQLQGTEVHSEVAVLHSYVSRWAIEWQPHSARFNPVEQLTAFYGALRGWTHAVDVVPPSADLRRYKLVVAPALNLLTEEDAKRLTAYVQQGGHLVLGPRSGMKDADNAIYPQRQPGPLAVLLGGHVDQFYVLKGKTPVLGDGVQATASIWAETLKPTAADTAVVLRYGPGDGWLQGRAAMLQRQQGRGTVAYLGTILDAASTKALCRELLRAADVTPDTLVAPDGVEVSVRSRPGHTIYIVVNFTAEQKAFEAPSPMRNLLTHTTGSHLNLEAYGVAVLETL